MFCEQCGAELEQDARFCTTCGKRLGEGDASRVGNGATNMFGQVLSRGISERRARLLQGGLIAAVVLVVALAGRLLWVANSEKMDVTTVTDSSDSVAQESKTELSRNMAAQMIAEQKYPRPVEVYLETQRYTHIYDDPRAPYMALEREGLIKHGPAFVFSGATVYKIELTEKGQSFSIGGNRGNNVKGCEATFVKVTGIAPVEFGFKGAQVEYEWTYDNQTPFHMLVIPGGQERPCIDQFGKPQKGTIGFRLYDDGWRIE